MLPRAPQNKRRPNFDALEEETITPLRAGGGSRQATVRNQLHIDADSEGEDKTGQRNLDDKKAGGTMTDEGEAPEHELDEEQRPPHRR